MEIVAEGIIAVKKRKKLNYKRKRALQLFLIAVPFMLYIFFFNYVPLFGWSFAFFNFKPLLGINLMNQQFAGFDKFLQMWTERLEIIRVLRNTMVMSGLSLLTSPLPVFLAILLSEVRSVRFKKLVQTMTTFPNFISWVIVFGLAFSVFSTNGLYAMLVTRLGGVPPAVSLLGNADAVWFFQSSLGLWKGLGWASIIYVAAIAGIDMELYNSAKIDGAGRFGCIRHITVPGVMPTFLVLLLLNISSILSNGFDQFFLFSNSMVSDKIQVLDLYTYQVGIVFGDYSYSTAIGITRSIISIALLFICNHISKRIRGTSLI